MHSRAFNDEATLQPTCIPDMSFNAVHINHLTRDILHGRLVHPSDDVLDTMIRHSSIDGIDQVPTSTKRGKTVCPDDGCHHGKAHRNTVPQTSAIPTPTKPGHITADVGGPMPVPSPLGMLYFLLLKDIFTNCMWIYFMKTTKDYCLK